jgi:hypothetical protein
MSIQKLFSHHIEFLIVLHRPETQHSWRKFDSSGSNWYGAYCAEPSLAQDSLYVSAVSHRILEVAENIRKIRKIPFAIQIDEATDSPKDAYLITYVRYVDRGK